MAMFKKNDNKDGGASEIVAELNPQFEILLEKLNSISNAVEKMGITTHDPSTVSGLGVSAEEPTIETEDSKARLAELEQLLTACEGERNEAQAKVVELNQRLEVPQDNTDSEKAEIERSIKSSEEELKKSEDEVRKSAEEVEMLKRDLANLTRDQETSSLKATKLDQELKDAINTRNIIQEDLGNYKSEIEKLQKEHQESQGESSEKIAEISQKLDAAEDAKRFSQESLDKNKSELDELQRESQTAQSELSREIAELTQKISICEEDKKTAHALVDGTSTKLIDLKQDYDSLSTERDTLTEKMSQMQRQIEIDGKLEALIWPDFLEKPEMQDWKQRMEEAVHQDNIDANVVVLVANLFNYNAVISLGPDWRRRLVDVLHDFSKALFAWAESMQYNPEQAVVEARMWASRFSEKSSGDFSIEIPEPDESFDTRVMVSYETGGASSSRDVKAVKTWCIKDGSGRILKQAEVTTC
jgi:chromosome segregation ATPase